MNNLVKKKLMLFITVAASSYFYLLVYTFIHEMGHGLVGVLCGGRIEKIVLGFNAHIRISGANYGRLTLPLMNVMGMLLPYMLFLGLIIAYKPGIKNMIYVSFHLIASGGIVGSMLAWIIIPIISMVGTPPAGDDVTNFLVSSGWSPVVVVAASLILAVFFFFIAFKVKGVHKNFFGYVAEQKTGAQKIS